MDISKGYLRLFRQILDWEWYDNPNVKVIFIHCLLCANTKAKKWRDMTIKRGQLVTSYEKLAAANGLTNQQTRTALKSLQLTNEIEYQSTNQYTVITVKNYNMYQPYNIQKTMADAYPNNKPNAGQITTTNNIDISNIYNNLSLSKKEITKDEREILKKYAKKAGARNILAYVKKLIETGDYKDILEEEKQKQEKKKQAETIKNEPEIVESAEEIEMARKKADEQIKKLRRLKNGKN